MSDDSSVDRVAAHVEAAARASGPGGRLPSTRSIGRDLAVGPVTVQRALQRLVAQGLVETRPGIGTFVSARPALGRADTGWQDVALGGHPVDVGPLRTMLESGVPGVLQMGAGHLDESLRADTRLAQAMARAARRPGVWGTPPTRGVPELRDWFAGHLGVAREDVLITSAGQAALSAVLRASARPGESVLFATPAYPGVLAIARSAGLTPVGVPTDADGLRVDLLEEAMDRSRARVLYVQPTYANPDGSVLSADRRTTLLDIAHRHNLVVVEDDWARWLGHGSAVPSPLQTDDRNGHVVTICSLSKTTAPSLRVGAVAARGPLAARIADLRVVDDFFVSGPLQHTAIDLVTAPFWRGHVRAVAAALRSRCAALGGALRAVLPDDTRLTNPSGGISLWLELPAGVSDTAVAREAAVRRLYVLPGSHYHLTPTSHDHLRLSFAALPEKDAAEAATRLASAVAAAGC
jgi:DNA-binding transcriptional MocR family regulator